MVSSTKFTQFADRKVYIKSVEDVITLALIKRVEEHKLQRMWREGRIA